MPTDNVNPTAIAITTEMLRMYDASGKRNDEDADEIIKTIRGLLNALTDRERAILPIVLSNYVAQLLRQLAEQKERPVEELLQFIALGLAKMGD